MILFDQLSELGVQSTVYTDQDHKTPIIRTHQDCMPILEQNKREANEYVPSWQDNPIRARKVASIPFVVMRQLVHAGIVSRRGQILDEPAFLAFLSDRDHRQLRCDNGKRLA